MSRQTRQTPRTGDSVIPGPKAGHCTSQPSASLRGQQTGPPINPFLFVSLNLLPSSPPPSLVPLHERFHPRSRFFLLRKPCISGGQGSRDASGISLPSSFPLCPSNHHFITTLPSPNLQM